jgi:hypothetical protein
MDDQVSGSSKLKNFWQKIKNRYGISSDWHAVFVLFIFAVAGSSILFIKDPIFDFLGYDKINNGVLRVIVYILIILPVYYVSLFCWSNVLGQGRIFNPIIKRMLLGYTKMFKKRKK